ncbi:hypothetical protein LY78DRAFT_158553 [Colletotrichum sublineola]|nr:hypothetical protein LY78DRAFT_158553 [Colletotrichum sublineola]
MRSYGFSKRVVLLCFGLYLFVDVALWRQGQTIFDPFLLPFFTSMTCNTWSPRRVAMKLVLSSLFIMAWLASKHASNSRDMRVLTLFPR